jgi:signal transduction histidine kinase
VKGEPPAAERDAAPKAAPRPGRKGAARAGRGALRLATAAVCALVATAAALGILHVQRRLATVAEHLPHEILEQQRAVVDVVGALEDLTLALRTHRLDVASASAAAVRDRLEDAEARVSTLREGFNLDNLMGAAAVHAAVNPAVADVRLWLELGVSGLPPTHPLVYELADLRAEGALRLARVHLAAAQDRAAEVLRGQARELGAFANGVTAGILAAAGLAVFSAILVYRRSVERRQAAAALLGAKEAAEEASRAKSRFLANMSHELRTPLNAILGFSELIRDGRPDGNRDRDAEYARDIHGAGTHLLSIIEDLLDLAKIEAGRFEIESRPVPLRRVVAAAVRTVEARAEAGGIALSTALDAGVEAVLGDERAVRQILINLLSNAVKFTRPGGRIAVAVRPGPPGRAVIEVTDTGIGIPTEAQDRVLLPFEQVDPVMARRHTGTGLGLPLSKSLAELQGGSLRLSSDPGRGTTVVVELPAHAARVPA